MQKKILIIHPEGNIQNNPNLFSLVKILNDSDFDITIQSLNRPEIYQSSLSEKAKLILVPSAKTYNGLKARLKILKSGYSFIIGVDDGLIEAEKYARILGVPFGFISYEIFFDDELESLKSNYFTKIKNQQRKACKDIEFAVVQDEIRSNALTTEYKIDHGKCIIMPVAGKGIKSISKTNYLHTLLNIPAGKRILLYMGWMDKDSANRIAEYAKWLPNDWVLVIHSRYKYSGPIPEIKEALSDKIYFSFQQPIENLDNIGILLGDTDAGFCSYMPTFDTPFTGKNISLIGMSSGKTSTFLQYGIPVVIENMNIWDKLVEKEGIGIFLKHPSDMKKLPDLYERTNAEKCQRYFQKNLDISNYSEEIVKKIQSQHGSDVQKIQICLFSKFILEKSYGIVKSQLQKLLN